MKKKLPRHEVIDQQEAASEACTKELEGTELEQVSGGHRIRDVIMIYGVPTRPTGGPIDA